MPLERACTWWIWGALVDAAPPPEAALLNALRAAMLRPDPAARPTFPELLAELDAGARAIRANASTTLGVK